MSIVGKIVCTECGGELRAHRVSLDYSDDLEIELDPCDTCWESAKEEGRDEAFEEMED